MCCVEGLRGQAALEQGPPIVARPRAHGLGENIGDLVLQALLLDVGERHVAGIGADDERSELLRLVGGFRGGADGDLLARRELVELFAEIALDRLFRRSGRSRDEAETGEADRDGRERYVGSWGTRALLRWFGGRTVGQVPSIQPARPT